MKLDGLTITVIHDIYRRHGLLASDADAAIVEQVRQAVTAAEADALRKELALLSGQSLEVRKRAIGR